MGLTDLLTFNDWVIESVDPEVRFKITGQYKPERGMTSDQKPGVTSVATAGSAEPDVQWVHGGSKVQRFSSRLRSKHNLDDIRKTRDQLKRLRQRDPTLGRGPRVSVAWGDDEVTGFVTSLRMRVLSLWVTGLPREIHFELEITGAPDVQADASGIGETQIVRLVGGETFETLGQRYLGSALRGELIRRINPTIAGRREIAGDRVKVFEREHPAMRGEVVPQAPSFLGAWESVVDDLGVARGSTDLGLAYEDLPEVVAGLVVI